MKGAGIREVLRWYERTHGRPTLRALADKALSPELIESQDLVLGDEALGVIASRWYAPEFIHAMLDAVFGSMTPAEQHEAMRTAADAAVRATGRGVYRFALERIVSPRLFAASIQVLWNMIHDSGERKMVASDDGIVSTTRGWKGHGPLLCNLMAETSAAVLETMGFRDVTWTRDRCVDEGHSECRIHYAWSDPDAR